MYEELLYSIWKYKLWALKPLFTTTGEAIIVEQTGVLNTDSGPDFSTAKIKIGDTVWVGNVEIHVNSSDWQLHGHMEDKAYDSVVLHVVYQHNRDSYRSNGTLIPTLELKNYVQESLIERYKQLKQQESLVPCRQQLPHIEPFYIDTWLERMALERMEQKYENVRQLLLFNKGDWEESFYQFLARSFGFRVNALPFEVLAQTLPNKLLAKHKDNRLQLEALFYGQAGLLNEARLDLLMEYRFLQSKYMLRAMDKHIWKFHRTRPQNFPDVRLAQFTSLVQQSSHLFSKIIETTELKVLRALFDQPEQHSFYFNSSTPKLGKESLHILLINAVAVFLFAYGKYYKQQEYKDRALALLDSLAAETNAVTHFYGLNLTNALQSQGLLYLKSNYCVKKRCLDCAIGNKVLTLA